MRDEEYVYSLNDEKYMELDEFLDYIEEFDDIEYVYVASKKPYTHSDFIDARDLIDEVCNRAYEEADDISDVYISCVEEKKHTEALQKIIEEYFNKNIQQPNFFTVKNVEKITYEQWKKD